MPDAQSHADPLALLRMVALRAPDAPALVSWNETLRYGELATRVARIASYIRSRTPDGAAVATLMPRTPTGLAGVLGCLLSGRVCMVLNPGDPVDRLNAILADAKPSAILADSARHDLDRGPRRIALDKAAKDEDCGPETGDHAPRPPDAPAAIFYTSGSTGHPKGIVLSMRAIMFRVVGSAEGLGLAPGDAVLATSPVSTSGAFCTLLTYLFAGAKLLVIDIASDGATALLRLAVQERPVLIGMPAPVLRMVLRLPAARHSLASVGRVVSGAAPLPEVDLARWRSVLPVGCAFRQNYASTEAGMVAFWTIPADRPDTEALVPTGYPRPGYQLAVVDEAGREVARGEAGELIITSAYLAIGEWRDGGVAHGRFPLSPESGQPCSRVFRTGDIMRHGTDGLLRFVSRGDRQVKVNGIRVEPGEIEAIIRRQDGIVDVLVMPRGDLGNATLHAFVAAPGLPIDPVRARLRACLEASLPHGMRPARITVLDALPVMQGGKVDGAALRALSDAGDVP